MAASSCRTFRVPQSGISGISRLPLAGSTYESATDILTLYADLWEGPSAQYVRGLGSLQGVPAQELSTDSQAGHSEAARGPERRGLFFRRDSVRAVPSASIVPSSAMSTPTHSAAHKRWGRLPNWRMKVRHNMGPYDPLGRNDRMAEPRGEGRRLSNRQAVEDASCTIVTDNDAYSHTEVLERETQLKNPNSVTEELPSLAVPAHRVPLNTATGSKSASQQLLEGSKAHIHGGVMLQERGEGSSDSSLEDVAPSAGASLLEGPHSPAERGLSPRGTAPSPGAAASSAALPEQDALLSRALDLSSFTQSIDGRMSRSCPSGSPVRASREHSSALGLPWAHQGLYSSGPFSGLGPPWSPQIVRGNGLRSSCVKSRSLDEGGKQAPLPPSSPASEVCTVSCCGGAGEGSGRALGVESPADGVAGGAEFTGGMSLCGAASAAFLSSQSVDVFDRWGLLTDDLLLHILRRLRLRDLPGVSLVCRRWQQLSLQLWPLSFAHAWGLSSVSGEPSSNSFWLNQNPPFVVYHQVQPCDTIASLAVRYGSQVASIRRLNSMMSDHAIHAHSRILIPLLAPDKSNLNRIQGMRASVEFDCQAKRDVIVVYQGNTKEPLSHSALSNSPSAQAKRAQIREKLLKMIVKGLGIDQSTAAYYLDEAKGDVRAVFREYSKDVQWERLQAPAGILAGAH